MRLVLGLIFIMLLSPFPLLADLSETTASYLREIGLDPKASEIVSVANEKVETSGGIVSLDLLALEKRPKREILRFVSTRRFVKAYLSDKTTRLPATDHYNAAYLSSEEKKLVQPAFRRAGDELYLQSLQQEKKK